MVSVFDLKGSTVDRESPAEAGTLKDTNFKNMRVRTNLFNLNKRQAARRNIQLENDVIFLRNCGLMDYSLLIGIERDEK